ncbi:hypothetical protein ACLOJK_021321 [Asimina triloba]
MRLKKGSKVEVLSKLKVPSGSWWCGEIVSGNGHTYDVKYDWTAGDMNEEIVERVARKFIRPCPPTLVGERNWIVGDIAEVFDNHSWKIAVVLKVVNGDYFFVRFIGYTGEFRVHKSDLRVRLSWKDNQWIIIGKDSGSCEDRGAKELSPVWCVSKHGGKVMKGRTGGKKLQGFDNQNGQVKRPRLCSSDAETLAQVGQKIRIIEKDGRCQQLTVALPAPFLEKVDAVASPKSIVGDNFMHASSRTMMTGFTEMDMARESDSVPTNIRSGDAESSTSPIASCSSANYCSNSSPNDFRTYPNEDSDYHSDSESSSGYEYGCQGSIFRKEDTVSELHELELYAYRSTMEALFASGPLSWEQEAMMTNLRLMLHISNDEHLFELRHLVSAES